MDRAVLRSQEGIICSGLGRMTVVYSSPSRGSADSTSSHSGDNLDRASVYSAFALLRSAVILGSPKGRLRACR